MTLLDIVDLAVRFRTLRGPVHAVNGVSLTVDQGETVALVGESGSGKSVTALAVLGLLAPTATVSRGRIEFEGRDLRALPDSGMRALRGGSISMVFQDPMTSLNPLMTVGAQVREIIEAHTGLRRKPAQHRAIELLDHVGIPDPADRAKQFPHQFSGGMRQRAVIAIAIACNPKLADRRRADHGTRCDDASPDPRPAARSDQRVPDGPAPDHPRPRRRRRHLHHHERDVRRTDHRDGRDA